MTAPAKPSTAECEFCGRETYASRVHRAPTMTTEEIATTCLGPRGLEAGPCLDATRARLDSLASDNARLRTALAAASALIEAHETRQMSADGDGPPLLPLTIAYEKAKSEAEAAGEGR